MEQEDRRQTIARSLDSVLEEGEAYRVYREQGEVWVSEADASVCSVRHPQLYGRLLGVNAELEQALNNLWRFPLLVVVTLSVGLHLRLGDAWLGVELVDRLDNYWFYGLVAFLLYQVLGFVGNGLAQRIYRRRREELFRLIAAEQLTQDHLVTLLEGDQAVASVNFRLKLDRQPMPVSLETPGE